MDTAVVRHETLEAVRAEGYRTTFTHGRTRLEAGDALPAGWEGLYFPFSSPLEGLRPDGTPADDLIPDTGLPRRMYAGEDTVFHEPLRVGDLVERHERLDRVVEKTGASGRLVFADIVREFHVEGRTAVRTTWHDVFLGESSTSRRPTDFEPHTGGWTEEIALDARQLFRFSALTFNTHRVHYDREWATGVEGLPGLLVHGPLTRMLLLDAATARRDGALPATFSFVALAPLWVDQRITIAGHEPDDTTTEVLAVDDSGHIAAKGTAVWS